MFLADDDAANLDAATLGQRPQRIDQERVAGWRIPFDENQLCVDAGPLELAHEEARRPPDTQVEIACITVVAKIRDKGNVWLRVHVELSRRESQDY